MKMRASLNLLKTAGGLALLAAGALALLVMVGPAHAKNAHINTHPCAFGTLAEYEARLPAVVARVELSAAEHAKILAHYTGYRNYTYVRLYTVADSDYARFVFAEPNGCAFFGLTRTLRWTSGLLGRRISHL